MADIFGKVKRADHFRQKKIKYIYDKILLVTKNAYCCTQPKERTRKAQLLASKMLVVKYSQKKQRIQIKWNKIR